MPPVPEGLAAALSDRYRLARELGAGGMATVYLAEDLKHRRKVAVKVLRPDLVASLGADRFLREIDVTAHLQHPHILPLYDSDGPGQALRLQELPDRKAIVALAPGDERNLLLFGEGGVRRVEISR